jgi:hypothetical protein
VKTLRDNSAASIGWPHYAGICVLSMATLLLELALTRVLSVANWYHFGFLVISTALLGFGAAGVTLSLWPKLREEMPLNRVLGSIALLFGVTTPVSFWLMQLIPFNPFRVLLDHSQLAYGLLYYIVLAVPFFCSGLAINLLLSRGGRKVNNLYAADLLGAGLGCVAVCAVMPVFGGSGSVVIAAMFGVVAALVFASFRLSKLTLFSYAAIVPMLALAVVADRALPIHVIPGKHHSLQPVAQSPMYTKWNSFSRIDLYKLPAAPEQGRPDPGFSIIIDAGTAGTAIPDLSMGVRDYLAHSPEYKPAGLAYIGKEDPNVLIIGSGAGREVLEALYYGASSITAVEINPITNDIVSRRMKKQLGGLFDQPEVRLVTEDGRSFVRRSKEKYDAIISLNTMSDAALTSGALSLSESYVMTREAFEDYWNHLTPNGTLLETGYQLPKLFATAREMFDHLRLGSPAGHLFAFRGMVAPFGPRQFVEGLLLQKSPLRPEDVDIMAQRLGVGRNEHWGDTGQPEIYYSPFAKPTTQVQTLLANLTKSQDLEAIYSSTENLIRPATDDKPFFYQQRRWSNPHFGFRGVLGAGDKNKNNDVDRLPVTEVSLVILLLQTVFVAAVLILLPLARFDRQGLRVNGRWAFLTYFAGLGVGFILIEIVFLQRFSLFLGEPIYTFSVVLGSLLISTGGGSYLAGRIQRVSYYTLSWSLLAVAGLILLALLGTPTILSWTLGLALPLRVTVAILLVIPLGILLGVPFPMGLRMLGKEASPLVPWAWAVNSFFTVIGSVGALILGMILGFTDVLMIAAGCYGVAWIAIRTVAVPQMAVDRDSPRFTEAA